MDQKKMGIIFVSIGLLLIIIGILYKLLHRSKEKYRKCICSSEQGGRERECQETDVVQALYNDNVLTEYSKLKSPGWNTVSPGDMNWPLSGGCTWPDNSEKSKQWFAWDFTDFGN